VPTRKLVILAVCLSLNASHPARSTATVAGAPGRRHPQAGRQPRNIQRGGKNDLRAGDGIRRGPLPLWSNSSGIPSARDAGVPQGTAPNLATRTCRACQRELREETGYVRRRSRSSASSTRARIDQPARWVFLATGITEGERSVSTRSRTCVAHGSRAKTSSR